jgi:hypothetical protein
MSLAIVIFGLISPFAYASLTPANLNLASQIYLNRITITNVLCLPQNSRLELSDHGQKGDYEIAYDECRKISSDRNYSQAAVCSQLEGDLIVEVKDNLIDGFQTKHVSEIRSLAIVQRACQ